MNIEGILDDKLVDIINRYAESSPSLGSDLKKSIENAKQAELIVPVLGMQGMGKSTLINALLEENIMPNDADETTCVPVEVKYGTDEHGEVYFKDGKNKQNVNTLEGLAKYVDNVQNPGNELGVSHIVLYRNREIVKSGLTIVDLPGVGSMTLANENTTKRYIENLCTAIFVIPTVPTIRDMEGVFIKSVWSQFTNAIFVQNVFNETKQEVLESIEYNSMRLKEIAVSLGYEYDGKIFDVNAYDALVGALEKSKCQIEGSKIKPLKDEIESLSKNWSKDKVVYIVNRLIRILDDTRNVIERKIEEQNKSKEEIRKGREEEYEAFNSQTRMLKSKLETVKSKFEDDVEKLMYNTNIDLNESIGKIRAAVFNCIDGGVYEGEHLSQAFKDAQEKHLSIFFNGLLNGINAIKLNVRNETNEIAQELDSMVVNKKSVSTVSVDVKPHIHFETNLDKFGGLLGTLGAGYVGTAASAKVGAAVGSLITPGVGTAVGAVVGIVIGVIGMFIGGKGGAQVTTTINNSRKSEAKKVVDAAISELQRKADAKIMESLSEFKGSVLQVFSDFEQKRKAEAKKMKENINNITDTDDVAVLREDKSYVETKIKEAANV